MIRRRRRGERVEQVAVARTLCVLVRCGSIVVAIPASSISRIALAGEVVETTARDGQSHVIVGKTEHRALDLGDLLELDLVPRAWLFVASGG
ncbi:MAG TPA: hypothetical protein VFF36_03520, partial [Planctomycetota bacterium]|nr:hypothetical protein [Planctomycetota bacterium]